MLTIEPYPFQNVAIDQALDRGNLLIAYGMGMGKTLITLGICEELLGDEEVEMNAIVVPASLKWQWAQAIAWGTDVERRTIKMKDEKIVVPAKHQCVVIDGTPAKRDELYRYAKETRPEYVLLGYENVVNDWRQVRRLKPDLIAADEITAIKTFTAERTKVFKMWDAPFRFGLTGTPIDNRPEELYSIMEWIDFTALGRFDLYDRAYIIRDSYGRPQSYKHLDVLHKKTKAFVARKTRFDPDVAPYMPKDFHREFYVDLTGKTKTLYKQIVEDLVEDLEEIVGMGSFDISAYYSGVRQEQGSEAQGQAMAKFSALTMLCDHPLLLLDSARKFERDLKAEKPVIQGSKYAWELWMEDELDWVGGKYKVPKFETALDQIRDILDEAKSKVILFSFSKLMLRLFEERITEYGYRSVIFDGDMSTAEKESAKMKFKRNENVRVFLSSDAGGLGVDLPEANYLINYNHPWSAGKSEQRNSRHIRVGSKWDEVFVLNYIVSGSVEAWKYEILGLKRRVGSAILDGKGAKDGVITNDVASLLNWLRG